MKPTKKTKKLWSSFKNEQKLFENWRQYTKGDALNEGILDWFGGGKEEEPSEPEQEQEPVFEMPPLTSRGQEIMEKWTQGGLSPAEAYAQYQGFLDGLYYAGSRGDEDGMGWIGERLKERNQWNIIEKDYQKGYQYDLDYGTPENNAWKNGNDYIRDEVVNDRKAAIGVGSRGMPKIDQPQFDWELNRPGDVHRTMQERRKTGGKVLSEAVLKRIIRKELQNEGILDWFGSGKEEEPAPEAQENPEAAAEAHWQALEDEFREVYRGVTDGVPHLDDCRSMECEKLIKKFWLMWEEVKPSPERRQEYISAYVEGGPKAAQKLVNDTWYFGDPSFRHSAAPDGSFRVDTKWVKELEGQKMFINNALKSFQNPSQPEPERKEEDEYEWRGGDLRRRHRERTPGGGYGLTRENKQRKTIKARLLKRKK